MIFSTEPTLIDVEAERSFLADEGALQKQELDDFNALVNAEFRKLADAMSRRAVPNIMMPGPAPEHYMLCAFCRGSGLFRHGAFWVETCSACEGRGRV